MERNPNFRRDAMKKVLVALVAALALAIVPAVASSKGKHSQCSKPVTSSYRVSGTFVSATSPLLHNGTYSGTVRIHVTSTNREARGAPSTFTVIGAHLTFSKNFKGGSDVGDHVTLTGTITEPKHGCPGSSGLPHIDRISVAS
jgi:hypothetical protein